MAREANAAAVGAERVNLKAAVEAAAVAAKAPADAADDTAADDAHAAEQLRDSTTRDCPSEQHEDEGEAESESLAAQAKGEAEATADTATANARAEAASLRELEEAAAVVAADALLAGLEERLKQAEQAREGARAVDAERYERLKRREDEIMAELDSIAAKIKAEAEGAATAAAAGARAEAAALCVDLEEVTASADALLTELETRLQLAQQAREKADRLEDLDRLDQLDRLKVSPRWSEALGVDGPSMVEAVEVDSAACQPRRKDPAPAESWEGAMLEA